MPLLKSLLTAQGTTFSNAFVTDSLCCPSRATILRSQYAHNHGILTNAPPLGGFLTFRDLGREGSTVATWLQGAGYRTAYFGKYMNGYGTEGTATHIPPGWNQWHATTSMSKWSENGTVVDYGSDPNYNQTDLLASKATEYILSTADDTRPFFMYLSPRPPHRLAVPAPRHQDAFADIRAPRPPSFNEEDVSDKPGWLQRRALLDSEQIERIDALYRKRLQTLLGLDELIEQVVRELEATGELDNTYVVFASDNGYHLGQHRLTPHKTTAYEEDIRVPLVVRGPGVPAGRELGHIVLNNDFAPTFAELAGVPAPDFVDGRSLTPLLGGLPPSTDNWRSAFLVEKWGDYVNRLDYKAIRTANHLYVEYSNGEHELYDLNADPYELQSQHATADPAFTKHLALRLEALRDCAATYCRTAEDGRTEYEVPTINITTPAKGTAYILNQDVQADYRCKDEAGGSGLKSCDGPVAAGSFVDTSSVGRKGFTVTAEDNAGNRNSATTNYRVKYKFRGFSFPVNNRPTLNSMQAGRAVPVTFGLDGDQGLGIFADGYPRSGQISCDPAAPVDAVEQTVRASTSGLSYDASTGRYTYTWKTYAAWAGTCRQLVIKLKDNTYRRANFRFE